MMKKPVMKKEVAVVYANAETRDIGFYSTQDAVMKFTEFGLLRKGYSPDRYVLSVDPRFDFAKVVDYIKTYGEEDEVK
jgi:hypothetical protein